MSHQGIGKHLGDHIVAGDALEGGNEAHTAGIPLLEDFLHIGNLSLAGLVLVGSLCDNIPAHRSIASLGLCSWHCRLLAEALEGGKGLGTWQGEGMGEVVRKTGSTAKKQLLKTGSSWEGNG